jgi:hypothetical protein
MYFYQFHICLWGCNDNVTEETDLKPESEGGRQWYGEAITYEQSF